MKKAVALLTSPLQVVNLVEYCHVSGISLESVTVFYARGANDLTKVQIERSLDRFGIASRRYIGNILDVRALQADLRVVEGELLRTRCSVVIAGDIRELAIAHLVNVCAAAECVLLDDGTVTLTNTAPYSLRAKAYDFVRSIYRKARYGLQTAYPRTSTMFTSYAIRGGARLKVVENRYENLRSRLDAVTCSDEVCFVGSCIVDVGIVTWETYKKGLLHVREARSASRMVYRPHRRSSPVHLRRVSELGFKVLPSDLPLELELASESKWPKAFVGYYSSIFFNLNKMAPPCCELSVIKLCDADVIDRRQARFVRSVYAQLLHGCGGRIAFVVPDQPGVHSPLVAGLAGGCHK